MVATGVLSVAGVTTANGADNLAVYTPLFRTIGLADSLATVAVFAVGSPSGMPPGHGSAPTQGCGGGAS